MRLADARQIQRLYNDKRQVKQDNARQPRHLGLPSDLHWELHRVKQAKDRVLDRLQEAEDNVQQVNKEKDQLLEDMATVEGHASKLRSQVSDLEQEALQSKHFNTAVP